MEKKKKKRRERRQVTAPGSMRGVPTSDAGSIGPAWPRVSVGNQTNGFGAKPWGFGFPRQAEGTESLLPEFLLAALHFAPRS